MALFPEQNPSPTMRVARDGTLLYANPSSGYANLYGRDITTIKETEETLRELNATLESKVAQRTAELDYRARKGDLLTRA